MRVEFTETWNCLQDVEHAGIRTYRFIPPENAMGSHEDANPNRKNPDNECYCMKSEVSVCGFFSTF